MWPVLSARREPPRSTQRLPPACSVQATPEACVVTHARETGNMINIMEEVLNPVCWVYFRGKKSNLCTKIDVTLPSSIIQCYLLLFGYL